MLMESYTNHWFNVIFELKQFWNLLDQRLIYIPFFLRFGKPDITFE